MASLAQQREEARAKEERKIYATRPDSPKEGDMWFDTSKSALRVYIVTVS